MAFTARTPTINNGGTNITTLACLIPASTVINDIIFCWVGYRGGAAGDVLTPTALPGFVMLGRSSSAIRETYNLFYRIAAGTEGGNSHTVTAPANGRIAMTMVTYTAGDYNPGCPIAGFSNTGYVTSNTTLRAASMIAPWANCPLVFVGGAYNATTLPTFTKPSVPTTGWVENHDSGNATSDYARTFDSYIWTGSGATGDMDNTISASHTTKHAFAVALTPVAQVGWLKQGYLWHQHYGNVAR